MSTNKHIDQLCAAALVLSLLLTIAFLCGESLGIQPASSAMGYKARLFNTSKVHTIDIVMDGWEDFLETCENEEYAQCAVLIDGEAYQNTGIRAKGNTSLSMVSSMNSDRYSFKLEFDHYDSGRTYYGLDKLSLNNLIQDTTYMKDYLTYQMMGAFGADAPLCSYAYITVNGQDWGLYLAVEGVEDAFLQRNYGRDYGELYKPDSMSLGGGQGNGKDFRMSKFSNTGGGAKDTPQSAPPSPPDGQGFGAGPDSPGEEQGRFPRGGGMGSDDVKLRYIDDDPDSYSNIFENAKTDSTKADKARLIASLKALSEGEKLEDVLDTEEVLRYFVVHNFVCNGDSYTGSMVHNYYLYEKEGRLSMIPWDYNLAYGTFQSNDAGGAVNAPIDSPVSGGDSRPMVDWIFDSREYTDLYHQYFQEFLDQVDPVALISETEALIASYVKKDPTRFYTYEEFETGAETLRSFCSLRAESVRGQLDGSITSTEDGQAADASALVDAFSITLSDMGTMNQGGGARPAFSGGHDAQIDSRFAEKGSVPPGQIPEDASMPAMETQSVEILRQSPPEQPESGASLGGDFSGGNSPGDASPGENFPESGFPGGGFPGGGFPGGESPQQTPAAVSESSLLLMAASLAVLLAGLLTAALFRRRKH